jgi:hypothetical protein
MTRSRLSFSRSSLANLALSMEPTEPTASLSPTACLALMAKGAWYAGLL